MNIIVKDGQAVSREVAASGSGTSADPFIPKHVVNTVVSSEILTDANGTRYVRVLVLEPITASVSVLRFNLTTGAAYTPVGAALEADAPVGPQLVLSFALNQIQSFPTAPVGAQRFLIWAPAGDAEVWAFTTDGSNPSASDRILKNTVDDAGFLEILSAAAFNALKFKLLSEGVPGSGGTLRAQPQA